MEPLDFVTALARLLRNRDLRAAFAEDPAAFASEMNVREDARAALLGLSPVGLEVQALGLITKRRHEAAKLMPHTFQALGADADELFAAYAERFWPEGHERHVRDAFEFAQTLKRSGVRVFSREVNRLQFLLERRRIALRVARETTQIGLQFLYRRRNGRLGECALMLCR